MANDAEIVVFRKFPDGEIIALFPNMAATTNNSWLCGSYMHVGRHGAADPRIVSDTQPAQPQEYAALKAELEQIGYRLDVRERFPSTAHERRQAELHRIALDTFASILDATARRAQQGDPGRGIDR
jgi:hypothetical protein